MTTDGNTAIPVLLSRVQAANEGRKRSSLVNHASLESQQTKEQIAGRVSRFGRVGGSQSIQHVQ